MDDLLRSLAKPEYLLALGTFAASIFAVLRGWFAERRTALKSDLASLKLEVAKLRIKLEEEAMYVVMLLGYIGVLQNIMRGAGLQVPELPQRPKSNAEEDL